MFREVTGPYAFFTTALVHDGRVVWLNDHLDRLEKHAAHFAVPFDRHSHGTELATRFRAGKGFRKLRVSCRLDDRSWDIEIFPAPVPVERFRCRIVEVEKPLGRWKVFPRRDFGLAEGEEAILVDTTGRVYEGSYTNLFIVRGETVLTPPDDGTILPGICRAKFLTMLRCFGYTAREEPFVVADLAHGEILLTNALRGVVPGEIVRSEK
ncbi:MAG TPA: aminotransferase class IV [bacterium]|nr:aminotransferase class IV [bacterium]